MFRHTAPGNPKCRPNLKRNRHKTRFPYDAKRTFPQRAGLTPRTQQKPRKNFRVKTDFVKRLFPFLRGFFREHFLFYRESLFCLFGASRPFLPHPRFSFRHNKLIIHYRPEKPTERCFPLRRMSRQATGGIPILSKTFLLSSSSLFISFGSRRDVSAVLLGFLHAFFFVFQLCQLSSQYFWAFITKPADFLNLAAIYLSLIKIAFLLFRFSDFALKFLTGLQSQKQIHNILR